MIPFFVLAAACSSPEADPTELLAPLPRDPVEALAACDREPFPELATTCRVEAAARAAGQELPQVAEQACAAIQDLRWREECHFRAGEELGRRGAMDLALGHCARAGRYGRFCITHTAWHAAPIPGLQVSDAAAVLARETEWMAGVQGAMDGAPPELVAEAEANMRATFWFSAYLGSGSADPAAARAAGPASAPAARSGFALEAVRLLVPREVEVSEEVVGRVLAVWAGLEEPPAGPRLDARHRHGRYHPPITTQAEADTPKLPQYGGGQRLVSQDADCDLRVATLEALHFRPETPAEVFLPYTSSECAEVRWTATRMIRVTPSMRLDHDAVLTELAASEDPGVTAQARAGLRSREWTLFTGGPEPQH